MHKAGPGSNLVDVPNDATIKPTAINTQGVTKMQQNEAQENTRLSSPAIIWVRINANAFIQLP